MSQPEFLAEAGGSVSPIVWAVPLPRQISRIGKSHARAQTPSYLLQ